jgi:hypothetical protein
MIALSNQSGLPVVFNSRKVNFFNKNSYQFRHTTSPNCSSPEDGLRLQVSSNPLLRLRLVVSRDLANLGKSSPGIWPFSVSSGIRPILKRYCDEKFEG